ncbi:hypothetical protein BKA58DRAFT_444622 [Alternaria rosae]|uniref:uncharacterized protein n=1 Tax=Alternaria rosae TaxID=1187941 RepID=UPI001E8EA356|nr:uncharacterized protein BKA58DRAFT_444622 [Alternaria rosae]KAH6852806.1 hypothetical protein BKA58DRAFT_444622 [Alternaria rosae]
MKFTTPLLTTLLTITSLITDASAHKDKKKIQAELDRDMTAHTLEAKAQARKKIDKNFKHDMSNAQEKHKHMCRIGAKIYYAGVRLMGRDLDVEAEHTTMNGTEIANATTDDTATIAAVATDSDTETSTEERAQKVFAARIAELLAHPEVLMEMTERDLENVETQLMRGLGTSKRDSVQEEIVAIGL